ncbi:protease SohB [Legionella dresdenensis]|uniref:Protease SohB n=1 Tax=Legionella dresdenensis TaxID=450200 RepID=A0ABV8CBS1_9GAMM
MNFLSQYGLFALEVFTLVIAVLLLVAGILAMGKKPRPKLEVVSLNKDLEAIKERMWEEIKGKKPEKTKLSKQEKKKEKEKPSLYVIDFNGDIKASQVEQLRDSITAALTIAKPEDEIVIRLESPGGSVNGYGLAASQLQRIRDRNIPLTVCIDKVAASGGYLMACVANQIVAAPFAYIGSIGVVAQLPNFHRWLKKNNIDIEMLTAGEYKRTLTMFGENTDKGREKFQEDLEKIHTAFKDYVLKYRKDIDINAISTGEHWLAIDAHNMKLIDLIKTSDDYLADKMADYNAFGITRHVKQSLADRLLKPAANMLQSLRAV